MPNQDVPLPVKIRPVVLKDFVGQNHILGEGKLLKRVIVSKRIPPLIFWGPAGCGKTTLGFILAHYIDAEFTYINAAFSPIKEVKRILAEGRKKFKQTGKKIILFIDEIHRFNKIQQEILVPDMEQTTMIFIGATIYNPRYYFIPSLVSRSIIAQFKPLTNEEIILILKRALKDAQRGLGNLDIRVTNKALDYIAMNSSGDARKALASLEIGALTTPPDKEGRIIFNLAVAKEIIQKNIFYDKNGSYHYDTISAFIKSIRGSDPDSALYWLAKMLEAGEDPRFIARRLVILSSEDIGNANPFALVLATNCFKAVEFVGMPEASLILAQIVIYLSGSPKSNSSYKAYERAVSDVKTQDLKEVPFHLKTHSPHYKYPHDSGGYLEQDYGVRKKYYFPLEAGDEKKLKQFFKNLKI